MHVRSPRPLVAQRGADMLKQDFLDLDRMKRIMHVRSPRWLVAQRGADMLKQDFPD